jgi:monolysocardiolipin acyltransferase
MPEGRRAPWKFFPRPGVHLSVTFGAPLSPAAVHVAMASGMKLELGPSRDGEGKLQQGRHVKVAVDAEAEVEVRIALTELMQRAVEDLGRQVSGDLLNGSPYHHHHQQRT